jgi:hypothetical protein
VQTLLLTDRTASLCKEQQVGSKREDVAFLREIREGLDVLLLPESAEVELEQMLLEKALDIRHF